MHYFYPIPEELTSSLPDGFNNPFDYTPHPLCLFAKQQLERSLPKPSTMEKGKMYGVLIVKNLSGQIGYLAAYSGNEKDLNSGFYFVPQVYDITNPSGFFRAEEQNLNEINAAIKELKNSSVLSDLKQQLSAKEKAAKQTIKQTKEQNKIHKAERDKKRSSTTDDSIHQLLIKQSQTEKSNFNKLRKQLKNELDELRSEIESFNEKLNSLKEQRKLKSAEVQKQLFDNYVFINADGNKASATAIFEQSVNTLPPAGTGDCAAPKLLQHAFINNYTPIAIAEFWWGPSPQKKVRKHGYFYPACKSKCEPLLGFMLKGLSMASDKVKKPLKIEVIYEDDCLIIINKPSGLLSVPGKSNDDSVYQQIKHLFPRCEEPFIVHRLDRDTSGLMIITKTKNVYINLQKQFLNHDVKKRYVAILDGDIKKDSGTIDLPLRVDLDDRPRQLVCYKHGKPAKTLWKVITKDKNQTRVHFYPLTGRTHQLRVHAAHIKGLNTPIVGDPLYGRKAKRLMLHAEHIVFNHPETQKQIAFHCPANF
ncbi:RluA family pseudouridine synthase [Carboxylicivirga sp. A043]|uniref:RluA family pseudouridine synthase n=1 Tax=Carboxylicivirga litoralis TaxID=2816963 RepID=UPI0021CB5F10|nr:RluA family pseudouridine synthase [Carboxylicivirga sp. A043]MCU4156421.1 RluA family pseudouridine synthase [Carboxylicivirga sp. A043]